MSSFIVDGDQSVGTWFANLNMNKIGVLAFTIIFLLLILMLGCFGSSLLAWCTSTDENNKMSAKTPSEEGGLSSLSGSGTCGSGVCSTSCDTGGSFNTWSAAIGTSCDSIGNMFTSCDSGS